MDENMHGYEVTVVK